LRDSLIGVFSGIAEAAAQRISTHTFKDENIVVELFLYYFIGLVISRIGSLTIEPAMKKTKFVKFAPYKGFVNACAKDTKVELLSEPTRIGPSVRCSSPLGR
jgi:hypothetical protein